MEYKVTLKDELDTIELAQNFGVQSIPMIVVMKNGKITNQVIGARPKTQILAMLD